MWNHRTYGAAADPEYPWGATIYGEKGTLKLSVHKYEFFPIGQAKPTLSGKALFEYGQVSRGQDGEGPGAARRVGHSRAHARLPESSREKSKPVADIEQGHISTASCILANLSMQLGRSLTWDAAKHQVVNDAEANKLLKRPYRAGYEHPAG